MLPVLDKPVIHYVVEEAVNSGLDEILIVVGAGKDAIINYFDKHALDESMDKYGFRDLPDIYFVRQKEQKGLADAIRYAQKFTGDEDFVVLLGDTIYRSGDSKTVTSQVLEAYLRAKNPVIAVERVPPEKVKDYGIVDPEIHHDNLFKIRGVEEKPDLTIAPSDLGITGIYAFQSEIYSYILKLNPGKNNELQLSDAKPCPILLLPGLTAIGRPQDRTAAACLVGGQPKQPVGHDSGPDRRRRTFDGAGPHSGELFATQQLWRGGNG
jgi:UTP--glucose-1-phosphate uridylyltransferase